jgi:hypothetical protein
MPEIRQLVACTPKARPMSLKETSMPTSFVAVQFPCSLEHNLVWQCCQVISVAWRHRSIDSTQQKILMPVNLPMSDIARRISGRSYLATLVSSPRKVSLLAGVR